VNSTIFGPSAPTHAGGVFRFFFRPFDAEQKKFVITITGHSDDLEDYGSPEGIRALMASHIGRDDIVFGDFEWVSYFRCVRGGEVSIVMLNIASPERT
jgi:hypothetical protein